jgi:anaerobic ribonucleoside-triphosphate reductase
MVARRDTINCCLYDMEKVLTGGFEMGNVWYNEPKTIDTAFDVMGDIVLSAAAQQYGGFTIPEVDKILEPYAIKTYEMYRDEFAECNGYTSYDRMLCTIKSFFGSSEQNRIRSRCEEYAKKKLNRDIEQGFQGWEYKFNTVGSSRGDYPFISISFGLCDSEFGKMINKACLKVRMNGQGKKGNKKPVLFPKLTFLYDHNIHGEGCSSEDVFEAAINCSQKAMYPDYLSLTGEGYIPSMYKKYGKVVSLMGCVHGDSEVTISSAENGQEDIKISDLWNRLTDDGYNVLEQIEGEDRFTYIDFSEGGAQIDIYDQMTGYVRVRKIIKNKTNEWILFKFGNGEQLQCTPDHPLPIFYKGRIRADEVCIGDEIHCYDDVEDGNSTRVVSIQHIPCHMEDSYDVETDTDHFTVNNIWSHNCRASLSPWYERGGMEPADDDDYPVFVGRFNMGAISLNLPLILAKARKENRDFYEVLEFYMTMIRRIHLRTYEYIGEMKASTNPLGFCEGGFYGGHLQPDEKIKPLLKPMTMSFGITALNELQRLYNGKSLHEDGEFSLEVMKWINNKINEYKHEDGILYAVYGSPAESLCFSGDTLAWTEDGRIPIKDLKEGTRVFSYDETSGDTVLKPIVSQKMTSPSDRTMYVHFENGDCILCTFFHPFAVLNGDGTSIKYKPAYLLTEGDNVVTSSGTVRFSNFSSMLEDIPVYNIEVEDLHNYFVCSTKESDAYLVHNCGLQAEQFKKLYGVIENVSDRGYVSNSFHDHVTEDITAIEKQNDEGRFWDLFNGGKIQYCRYPLNYNAEAMRIIVRRAMDKGFYEGVNMSLAYCDDCGHSELEMDVCPKCGSRNLTKIDRMNGYLAYSRVKGDTRLNKAKMEEIKDRKSM